MHCTRKRGRKCHFAATLTAIEKIHDGRVVAVIASRHRSDRRTIVLAHAKKVVGGGERAVLTLTLTAEAERLLKQRSKLPALLTVLQTDPRRTVVHRRLELRS